MHRWKKNNLCLSVKQNFMLIKLICLHLIRQNKKATPGQERLSFYSNVYHQQSLVTHTQVFF